jgi:hypothetical protein
MVGLKTTSIVYFPFIKSFEGCNVDSTIISESTNAFHSLWKTSMENPKNSMVSNTMFLYLLNF